GRGSVGPSVRGREKGTMHQPPGEQASCPSKDVGSPHHLHRAHLYRVTLSSNDCGGVKNVRTFARKVVWDEVWARGKRSHASSTRSCPNHGGPCPRGFLLQT